MSEPIAWLGPDGQLMQHDVYLSWVYARKPADASEWRPLALMGQSPVPAEYAIDTTINGEAVRYSAPDAIGVAELMRVYSEHVAGLQIEAM